MKSATFHPSILFLCILFAGLLFNISPLHAADGKKWDGKAYPFKLLDPSKPNSESNPFIISTAGQFAYFAKLAKADFDMVAFGKEHGLTGLNFAFQGNYVKLTADLDLNGSKHEWIPINDNAATFDGGGHVITNMRISDKTTKADITEDMGDAEISLALFKNGGIIKNLGIGKGSSVTYRNVGNVYHGKHLTLKVSAAALAVEADEIENCFSEATVTVKGNGDAMMAGLAVTCAYKITNSSNRGAIVFEGNVIDSRLKNRKGIESPGDLEVAGLCATPASRVGVKQQHAGIFNCYNTGSITVKASGDHLKIGGVASEIGNIDCVDIYNTGKVSLSATGNIKTAFVGGVLGSGITSPSLVKKPYQYIDAGLIYNKGNINVSLSTGKDIHVGGISGGSGGGFNTDTYAFGGVYGFINTCNTGSVSVSSTGKVEALDAGGIAGYSSMVINSYNTGSISCNSGEGTSIYAGGLGGSEVYIQNSYSIGAMSSKGSGTNVVGGIVGNAAVRWGEADNKMYSVSNGFWLKQPQEGGINSDVKYAKGSYFYMNKKDMKSTGLHGVLDALDKLDGKKNASADEMVDDGHFGIVYAFDSPTSSVLKRTDDGTGKRKDYNGTLLQVLNETAQERQDRKYHKWKVDASLNNGYPVLE
jgi:hypothetical protein